MLYVELNSIQDIPEPSNSIAHFCMFRQYGRVTEDFKEVSTVEIVDNKNEIATFKVFTYM